MLSSAISAFGDEIGSSVLFLIDPDDFRIL